MVTIYNNTKFPEDYLEGIARLQSFIVIIVGQFQKTMIFIEFKTTKRKMQLEEYYLETQDIDLYKWLTLIKW